MELWQILIVLLIVVGAGVAAWAFTRRRRTEELRGRFGPEYERAVEQTHDRTAAEQELDERRKRVEGMELRTLEPQQRERYLSAWTDIQAEFVDNPSGATTKADRLIEEVMAARGYPTGIDFEQRAADLSVNHPRVVSEYRSAREISERHAAEGLPTEMLRRGFVHYRALFEDLLDTVTTDTPEPAEARSR